jgi:hypothetical protein
MKRRAKRIAFTSRKVSGNINGIAKIKQLGYGTEVPPHPEFVAIYFDQQKLPAEGERFYRHYEKLNWETVTGKPIRNWKVLAADWIFDHRQEQKRVARLAKF